MLFYNFISCYLYTCLEWRKKSTWYKSAVLTSVLLSKIWTKLLFISIKKEIEKSRIFFLNLLSTDREGYFITCPSGMKRGKIKYIHVGSAKKQQLGFQPKVWYLFITGLTTFMTYSKLSNCTSHRLGSCWLRHFGQKSWCRSLDPLGLGTDGPDEGDLDTGWCLENDGDRDGGPPPNGLRLRWPGSMEWYLASIVIFRRMVRPLKVEATLAMPAMFNLLVYHTNIWCSVGDPLLSNPVFNSVK